MVSVLCNCLAWCIHSVRDVGGGKPWDIPPKVQLPPPPPKKKFSAKYKMVQGFKMVLVESKFVGKNLTSKIRTCPQHDGISF